MIGATQLVAGEIATDSHLRMHLQHKLASQDLNSGRPFFSSFFSPFQKFGLGHSIAAWYPVFLPFSSILLVLTVSAKSLQLESVSSLCFAGFFSHSSSYRFLLSVVNKPPPPINLTHTIKYLPIHSLLTHTHTHKHTVTMMESLLSLAFDNLSSYDGPKVRKGLRQVEGLLAQICLSNPNTADRTSRGRDPDRNDNEASLSESKDLGELSQDPAFREFFKLQEGFEWNVAMRLIGTLDRLMAKGSDGQNDLLILSALDLIQGTLLLHPPSKTLFSREQNMNVSTYWTCLNFNAARLAPWAPYLQLQLQLLLDLLEPFNCPAIQSATLLTLVTALIDTPRNTRTFEDLDGLLTVTSLFKSRSTAREVKLKLVEFLYFYLMPEMPSIPRADQRDSVPGMLQRSPSKLAGAFSSETRSRSGSAEGDFTLSTAEKQELLSQHLSSVEDLVKDLRNCAPFGGAVCWDI
jgi:hypothetical protein